MHICCKVRVPAEIETLIECILDDKLNKQARERQSSEECLTRLPVRPEL